MAKKLKDDKQWGLKQLDLDDIIEEFENTVNEVLQIGVDDNENKPSQAAKPYPRKNPPAWARIEKIKEEREIEKLFDPFDGLWQFSTAKAEYSLNLLPVKLYSILGLKRI